MAEKKQARVKGGLERAKRLTKEERSEIARNAALERWQIMRATHEGILPIGGVEIPCSVLEDGTRLLSRTEFLRAIGRRGKAKGGRRYDEELPVFITAENLQPFLPEDIQLYTKPVDFRPLGGGRAIGYRAELLPHVCNVFLDAKEAGVLKENQEHIYQRARILNRAFSVVGITALIDEVTGYQKVRERDALQRILDAYLRKELAAWAKRFPDEFYAEYFRLRGWDWTPTNARRPALVAKDTNDLVYLRLAPDLLKELEARNPKDERGRRSSKHHQWLTTDVGEPALSQHLHAVVALMRASRDWRDFKSLIDRALPRKTRLDDLPLFKPSDSPSTAV